MWVELLPNYSRDEFCQWVADAEKKLRFVISIDKSNSGGRGMQ